MLSAGDRYTLLHFSILPVRLRKMVHEHPSR